jgi:hypothetical protein
MLISGTPTIVEAGPQRSPSWSPDGRSIAFVEGNPCASGYGFFRGESFVVSASGTREQRLPGIGPDWSPVGLRVATWDWSFENNLGGPGILITALRRKSRRSHPEGDLRA